MQNLKDIYIYIGVSKLQDFLFVNIIKFKIKLKF